MLVAYGPGDPRGGRASGDGREQPPKLTVARRSRGVFAGLRCDAAPGAMATGKAGQAPCHCPACGLEA